VTLKLAETSLAKSLPSVPYVANFLYMLPVAVARSSSDDSAIRYLLPVLFMTSCFHIMDQIGENQRRRAYVWSSSPGGGTGGEVCRLRLHRVCDCVGV